MTLQKALDQADGMRANMMPRAMKVEWLSEIEQLIWHEILMKHEHTAEEETMPAYDEDTDSGTVLLVPDPYSRVYKYWLMFHIDEQNLEFDKCNNDKALFEQAYETMSDWWTRTKMPISPVLQLMI